MSPWLQHDLLVLTLEHITLVLISVIAAILVGVPLGIVIYRVPTVRRSALSVISIVQTIPSLALFGFLIPIPFLGVGKRTAVVALVLYALLPIVRTTFTGLLSVDEAVRESAVAMGMTPNQVLRIVEIPLALRTILTRIRASTRTSVMPAMGRRPPTGRQSCGLTRRLPLKPTWARAGLRLSRTIPIRANCCGASAAITRHYRCLQCMRE